MVDPAPQCRHAALEPQRLLWTITVTVLVTVLAMLLSINFAGPEKKIERRVEHHHTVADPQFRREMSVMLGPSIVGGNRVEALNNGDEIFPPMLRAIAQAQRSITFETYIFESDTLQAGVEFHEYQPSLFHNKLLIVDRELVSVGSPNFDERSLMLNDETSLNVYDRGFAETMTAVFEADLRRAKPYTLAMWQRRPLRESWWSDSCCRSSRNFKT